MIDLPLGATLVEGGVRFGLWSTVADRVAVVIEDGPTVPLEPEGRHLFSATVPGIAAGARYRFQLDDDLLVPDPRSQFQPEGPHGPSQVVDHRSYEWQTTDWPGLRSEGLVIYELHVGTFTESGTYRGLIAELPYLAELGIDAIELMPLSDCPGRWNWGYDGVNHFAPNRNYGTPDELKALIDAARAHGLGVLIDVVYNHFGPDGNYLGVISPDYFTSAHQTPWGDAINYDGPESAEVRRFVIDNVLHWLRDYRFDGLRLDATEYIVDTSARHILQELTESVHREIDRPVVIIAEEARNLAEFTRSIAEGGMGLNSVWADDFHHALHVRLTGEQAQYYADFTGSIEEMCRAINDGWVYQGEVSPSAGHPRGTPPGIQPKSAFTFCLQNHDQVGNRPFGDRLHTQIDPDSYRAVSLLLLALPHTLLLFMGQEYAARTPFQYFTDHNPELGKLVTEGRRREFAGFHELAPTDVPDPQAESTFRNSVLQSPERTQNAEVLALYRTMLEIRRTDPVLKRAAQATVHARPLSRDVLAVHLQCDADARTVLVNFGGTTTVSLQSSIALADSSNHVVVHSNEERFGGIGEQLTVHIDGDEVVCGLQAHQAVILAF